MRVIVWQGYGHIDVWAVDTPEQIKLLIEAVKSCCYTYDASVGGDKLHTINTLHSLCEWVSIFTMGDDNFERFERATVRGS